MLFIFANLSPVTLPTTAQFWKIKLLGTFITKYAKDKSWINLQAVDKA